MGAAMAMTLYEPAFAILTRRYPLRYRQGITTLTLVAGFASTLSFRPWPRSLRRWAGAARSGWWRRCSSSWWRR
jgi:hypothetical protein